MSEHLIHGEADLVLPDGLVALIKKGVWPTSENSQQQNLKPIYRHKKAYKNRLEMERLYFYPPPFTCVADDIERSPQYWKDKTLTELFGKSLSNGLEPALALIIGDFGPGTDAVLVLDYQLDKRNPRVMGMDYGERSHHKGWTVLADTFDGFCDYIKLH